MARALNRLSARFVATNKEPGRHADGGGLYLSVSSDGARRRWVFFYKLNGRQREMGLGSAQEVTLAEARKRAETARRLLSDGMDPIEVKRAAEKPATIPSFGEMADEYIAAHAPSWRNPKHIAQWRMTLSRVRDEHGALTGDGYCIAIRALPVNEITTANVLAVLQPIWQAKPETASRLRGRLEAVLDAAKVAGHRDGPNPAAWRGHLALILPKPGKLARHHHAAMAHKDVPAFLAKLRLARGVGAFALEFAILTAARSGEVRGATWNEIDLDAALWTVPPDRMKSRRAHRVPLSDRAVEILRTVLPLRTADDDGSSLIFPGTRRGAALSDMTLTATMRRHGAGAFTPHGFRSSFRDWAGDATSFPREVAEAALAHVVGDATEAAYRRGDALDKRRKLMQAWANYIEPKGEGNIVPLKKVGA